MSPLFTAIVVILALLAVMGIVVGVANDAVNFLQLGPRSKSRTAPRDPLGRSRRHSVGTLTSSGMMEVARSGVFYPAVLLSGDYDAVSGHDAGQRCCWTSTTRWDCPPRPPYRWSSVCWAPPSPPPCSASPATRGPHLHLSQFINTGKAMVIIAAILLSVALAFVAGTLFMYISRLIFSFRYAAVFRRWGRLVRHLAGESSISRCLKGLKSSGLIPTSVSAYVGDHVLVTLLAFWAAASLLLYIFQRMRLNIMRITILSGTFSLALAFAGNDLVNFIGVPLASRRWRAGGRAKR